MKKQPISSLTVDKTVFINKFVNSIKTLVAYRVKEITLQDVNTQFESAHLLLEDVETKETHTEDWYTVETIRVLED